MHENYQNYSNQGANERPLWKTKIFVIPIIAISLVLSVGVGFFLGQKSGYTDGYNAKTEEIRKILTNTFSRPSGRSDDNSIASQEIKNEDTSSSQKSSAKIGEEMKVKFNPMGNDYYEATFKSIDYEEKTEIKGKYKSYKADSGLKFVVINFALTNNGLNTISNFDTYNLRLIDSKHRSFTVSQSSGCLDIQSQDCITYKKLTPNATVTGTLTFDVSADSADYILAIPVIKENDEKDFAGINFYKK